MKDVDEERSARLRSVDLTSGLDRVALARLAAYMEPVAVRAGDTIITEGETGDALYIVVRGTFGAFAGADGRVNTIGPGHYVGELALLVDEPRSATIRADTDGEVLRLDRERFTELLGRDAAAARSGLLLRLGLLLIERVPAALGWQSTAFLLTGIVLTPLLPLAMARAAITAPLAEGVADTLKLRERSPASATLGLSAWVGSGPFIFLFMNGSPVCLMAWSLMPLKDQIEFTWLQWFISAAPLAAIVAAGSYLAMRLLFRSGPVAAPSRDPLRLQRAILGPMSRRELAILAIVALMLAGWVIGPRFLWQPGLIALIAFIAVMVATGVSQPKDPDWEYLIFFGVALSVADIADGLSLDKIVGESAAGFLATLGLGGAAFVILAGVLTIVVKSFLAADQAILLLSLALIPVATAVHISPWLGAVAILALGLSWHIPAQSPEYLVAYGATHGRLYSYAQGRRMALAYEAIALAALALSLPYWHLLGLI